MLAGAAFGPRFGLLLGLCSMAVSAIVTGGIGPWLPFQMLALAWMGGMAGLVGLWTARLAPRAEVVVLAAYGWIWGFLYGAIMNLWFWPFARGGALDWHPGLGFSATLNRYWSFYVATSLGWDAAAAITNALLILDHRRRAPAHPPPLRPPPRTRRGVHRRPRTGVTQRGIATHS